MLRAFVIGSFAFIGSALILMIGGCVTNAATGRSQFDSMSRDEEISIGTEAGPQMVQEYGGRVDDADLQRYVTDIGQKLAAQTEADNPSLPWEFTLLNSDVINAFALPGGKVFVTRGLAEKMTNEGQLAGVLGHEIGHVTAQHTDERMSRSQGVGILVGVVGVIAGQSGSAVAAAAPAAFEYGGQLFTLKYDRGQELEADALGMRYMSRIGYNPIGQRQVMEILASASGDSRESEFLATHPHPESRIADIDSKLRGEYATTQNNPSYQLYPERFNTQFLSKLARYKPAAAAEHGTVGAWCMVCAK